MRLFKFEYASPQGTEMAKGRACAECGRRLNRYSPGDLCGSCVWEARARVGEPPNLPPEFWAEPAIRQALADRNYTAFLRIYLDTTGLTQEAAGLLLGKAQGDISKIYKGSRVRYSLDDIEAFRDGLHIPGSLLGLQPGQHELAAHLTTRTEERTGPTNRRTFHRTVILAALGISGSLADAFTGDDLPPQIGIEHVRALEHAITQLEAQDAAIGGGRLSETASWLYSRASGWLHHGAYSVEVGEALHSTVGELGAWAGWLAQDADQQAKAREQYQDTLLLARMADDPHLEVRVLSYMALQSVRIRPREAVQMAHTAQRIAAGWGTPRLLALLHLRAAHAYAVMHNEAAFGRELARAKQRFEHGDHPDDPLYIQFVTPNELSGMEALCYLDLDRPDRATPLFREVVEHADRHRNGAIWNVVLAESRIRAGDITEACELGVGLIPVVSALDSGRTRRHLHGLRDKVSRHRTATATARDFVDAHDAAFTHDRS